MSFMKPSLQKLSKFFKLEAERGYDNHAVLGGLERMLDHWETQARAEEVPDELIAVVTSRIRDYARLTPASRAEVLDGIWKRVQQSVAEPQEPLQAIQAGAAVASESPAPESDGESVILEPAPEQLLLRPKPSPAAGEPAALEAPVTVLAGIGERNAKTLERLGLCTLRDMLYHFPRRYDDYTLLKPINRLNYGETVTIIGTVQSVHARKLGVSRNVVEAVVSDGSGSIRINWFNQPWRAKDLHAGTQVVLSGKIDQYLGRAVMTHPEMELLDRIQLHTNRIVPVYPLTANVKQRWLRRQINQVVTYWSPRVQDPLPEHLRRSAGLLDLPTALLQVHAPDSWDDLHAAQDRLAFDEIFLLQLGMLRQKAAWMEQSARQFPADEAWLTSQVDRLPFRLTAAQDRVLNDIKQDLVSGHPMNRLIQGDVGSGKTILAALAIAIVARHGSQAALMAPTSILAEQHYKNLVDVLAGESVAPAPDEQSAVPVLRPDQIRLMLGATPEAEKREIRAGLEAGHIKLVIGTHALIEDPIAFADLQLAIIDEQHRFGVVQRAQLRSKGENPHLIVMTATPIPRSLALTIYGDLDLSVIDEMPPGRQPVRTHVLRPIDRERAYNLINRQVELGHQAFIIYPLVGEGRSDESNATISSAAVEEHARLQNEVFPTLKLGLMHGRLPAAEKEEVMTSFRDGEIHILVSTSVVEVGVDIPNATVMIIEGANRFGLAQLHQFRGRVGRGSAEAYCLLIPDTSDDTENERLQAMVETNDGFVLAERDLEQRGPGQFLGTRQSGYTEFEIANLTNVRLIEKARRHAQELYQQNPDLSGEEYRLLADFLQRSWNQEQGDIS
jgi:ATP-dependent DNA helicase RecG